MKKTLAIIATACAASLAYGQGTVIIENVNGAKILPINLADGSQAKGPNYQAGLWYKGAQVGTWYTFAANGRFTSGGGVDVPGTTAAGTADGLTVRAWDTTSGASYDAATIKGESTAFSNPLGGGTTPPPKLINMPSFALSGSGPGTDGPVGPTPGPVIPEPSTVALGVLGAAALLLRFRK